MISITPHPTPNTQGVDGHPPHIGPFYIMHGTVYLHYRYV